MVGGRPPEETSGGTQAEASRYVHFHFHFHVHGLCPYLAAAREEDCYSSGGGGGMRREGGGIHDWAIERPTEWYFNWTELLRMHVLSIEQDSWIFEPDEGY